MTDRPLTVEMAADYLSCSPAHVKNLCARGQIRHFRIGRLIRIPAAALEELECASSGSATISMPTGETKQASPAAQRSGLSLSMIETWFVRATLGRAVEVDPKRRGGVPVIKGTRFTISQALAELAESGGIKEVADRFALDPAMIRDLLYGLAAAAEYPVKASERDGYAEGFAKGAREMRERAAKIAATFFSPAHTYASENADIYRAQDDAQRRIAEKIRALAEYEE